jgi:hypothetical protein
MNGNYFLSGYCGNVIISGNAGDGARHLVVTNESAISHEYSSGVVATNVQITYVNFTALQVGFNYQFINNVEFDNCTAFKLQSSDGQGDHFFTYQNTSNYIYSYGYNRIHDNVIYLPENTGLGDDGFTSMAAIDYYNNTIIGYYTNYTGTQHGDGFQSQWGFYCRIFNNQVINMSDAGIFPEGMSAIGYNYLQVFNNIVERNKQGGSVVGSPLRGIDADNKATGNVYTNSVIANNLIVDNGASTNGISYSIIAQVEAGSCNYTGLTVANNISINSYASYAFDYSLTNVDNLGDYTGSSIGTNFVAFTPYAGTNNSYNLTVNSMFRGAGTNLTALGITNDIAGNARPATGNWDVGPYQYVGASMPPPTRLTITGANLSGVSVQ